MQAVTRICPECDGQLIQDTSEVVCSGCGYVVEPIIDLGPERRIFSPEDSVARTRTGPPSTLQFHDRGLSTIIGGSSRDPDKWLQLQSLRKWQSRVRIGSPRERNLALALSEIGRLASQLSLPRNVTETASFVYRRVFKNHLVRGRTIQSLAAAALYLACRESQLCRSLDEIAAAAAHLQKKEVARNYRLIVNALDRNVPPASQKSYASMFANRLKMSGQAEILAMKLLQAAEKARLSTGRGPRGLAAASTYMASVLANEQFPQRTIAEAAGVTEVTIRNRYKEMVEKLRVEIAL